MASLAVSNRVIARNGIGRFAAACERAATETVRETVKEGAKLSKAMAPEGHKTDTRTIPLADSIDWRMTGRTSGEWYASARHALAQELGAAPHTITGELSFFWEAEGRDWIPASAYYHQPGLQDVINHPGNPPQPYLRPAYEVMMAKVMQIARSKYPG